MLSAICFVKLIKHLYAVGERVCQMLKRYVTQIAFTVLICDVSLVLRMQEFVSINIIKRLAFVICVR